MFTARFHMGLPSRSCAPASVVEAGRHSDCRTGKILRIGAFCALLALGLPRSSAAQAVGTMQVSARVVAATAAWTGLEEAGLATRMAVREQGARPVIRNQGVVRTRAEIHQAGDQRLVLVTVQYPRN
jgi:hypothetical protein